jgi:hypothetical protein
MMAFLFCQVAHPIAEAQSFGKIPEAKNSL